MDTDRNSTIRLLAGLGGFDIGSLLGKKLRKAYWALTEDERHVLREGTEEEQVNWLEDNILDGQLITRPSTTHAEVGDLHYVIDAYQEDIEETFTGAEKHALREAFTKLSAQEQAVFWSHPDNEYRYNWVESVLTELHDNNLVTQERPSEPYVSTSDFPTHDVTEPIRHTKHAQGCFQAAGDDEPVFTLRAKDYFAPILVLQWAQMVEASTDRETLDAMTGEAMHHFNVKLDDARHCARAMVEWQRNNTLKIPD